jgi:hypothetical protein
VGQLGEPLPKKFILGNYLGKHWVRDAKIALFYSTPILYMAELQHIYPKISHKLLNNITKAGMNFVTIAILANTTVEPKHLKTLTFLI